MMKKNFSNNNLIVLIVLLFIVALVALNFERFTGRATKTEFTKLYVSDDPDIKGKIDLKVNSGDTIYFTVEPGSEGSSGTVVIYDMDRTRPRRITSLDLKNCGYALCKHGRVGTARWTTVYDYKGRYCGIVNDLKDLEKVKACFTIK